MVGYAALEATVTIAREDVAIHEAALSQLRGSTALVDIRRHEQISFDNTMQLDEP
jgi:hypothetical protein